jgi:hypothetical protein
MSTLCTEYWGSGVNSGGKSARHDPGQFFEENRLLQCFLIRLPGVWYKNGANGILRELRPLLGSLGGASGVSGR